MSTVQTGSKNTALVRKIRKTISSFKYPTARTVAESEDTLLIKAIEYIPPTSSISKAARSKDTKDLQAYKNQIEKSTSAQTGIQVVGIPKEKGDGFDLLYKNAGGMDRRIREGFKNDKAGFREKVNYYIELPIPQQVADSNSVTWGEDTMNIMQAALAGAASAVISGDFGTLAQSVAQDLDLSDISEDTAQGIKNAISGKALDVLGTNVNANSLLGRATGQILNSNLELLFQGVNLRSFPLNLTFSPRSAPESMEVKNIIRSLKKSMSPKRGDNAFGANKGIFIQPPDVFLLRYLSNGMDHPFLNVFKPCALTNMNVNYTGAGTYATYGDATPVNIKVSLLFKEINPVYAEDYDESQGESGVGF